MALALIVQLPEGLAGANVYDDLAAWVGYLTDHGYPKFVALEPEVQTRIAIDATIWGEDQVAHRFDQSDYLDDEQELLFPRDGAVDRRGRLTEGLPGTRFRSGLMLIGEHMAASKTTRIEVGRPRHVKSERVGPWAAAYRDADVTFEELYPDVWRHLKTAFPAGLRQRRA